MDRHFRRTFSPWNDRRWSFVRCDLQIKSFGRYAGIRNCQISPLPRPKQPEHQAQFMGVPEWHIDDESV